MRKVDTLQLRPLRPTDETSVRLAVEECARLDPSWEFAFQFTSDEDFPSYVNWVNNWPMGQDLPVHFVANTYRVATREDTLVGRVSIRHELWDPATNIGGHVGYGILPGHQGRGLGTELLRMSLPLCLELGLLEILITCDEENVASRRVIEKNGGVFWDSIPNDRGTRGPKLRYWLDVRGQLSD